MSGGVRRVGPQRWLELALDRRMPLELPFAAHVARRPTPYATGPRTLDLHLVWLIERGRFAGRAESRDLTLEPGCLLWVPPGAPHDFTVPSGVQQFGLRIDLRQGAAPLGLAGATMLLREAWATQPLFAQIVAEARAGGDFSAPRLRGLVVALAAGVFRAASAPTPAAGGLSPDQRLRLQRFVAARMRERLTPAALARAIGLSGDYFTRVFRRSFGLPPRRWLVEERLRQGRALLARGLSVKEAAHAVGHRDPELFSRQFRRAFGRSPRAWRRTGEGL
jgi:AraC-like DNA-binding protein